MISGLNQAPTYKLDLKYQIPKFMSEEDTGEIMNRFEGPGSAEAKIKYLDGDFQIVTAGTFVTCAVTGQVIPLDDLKYWSVEKQEAYVDVEASVKASRG